jgi:Icc-related predicted phosphoesterase
VRYGKNTVHQYTQKEASKLARRLPAADVLICHCPPLGINDDPEDPSHIGFEGLRDWVDEHRPRHLLHGHVHPLHGQVMTRHGDTRVHWISGSRVLDLS